jgi:predicted nucleic acid-binding protein
VIVVDTSAWVEVLRATGSPADLALTRLMAARTDLALTEAVVMELRAGTSSDAELEALQERLDGFPLLPLHGLSDFEAAADLFRICTRAGERLRGLSGCLVAVPAIRAGAPILHADGDFDTLARHTPLEVVPLDE